MTAGSLTSLILVPIGRGLLGFVEPCSLGSTLIVVKHLEGKRRSLQRGAWIFRGAVYVLLGVVYVVGKAGVLSVSLGPSVSRFSSVRGSAGLGVLFGLNIPACAAPLLVALLSAAAAGGAAGGTLMSGFVSLALFGFALSLPLAVAVFEPARRAIDWLAELSRRLPFWTGMVLIALGLWSIWIAISSAAMAVAPMGSM